MTTTITLLLTDHRSEEQSLIAALDAFCTELDRPGEDYTWQHIQDVQGGFRFELYCNDVKRGEGMVRSDFIRPGGLT